MAASQPFITEPQPFGPFACLLRNPCLKYSYQEMDTDAGKGKGTSESKISLLSKLQNIPASFLKEITDNLSSDREIGDKGAFGTVYKGILEDGDVIAVKKLGENCPVGQEKSFDNEVRNLMAVQHTNIVKLLGFCHETQKKVVEHNKKYIIVDVTETFLCYEYVPKGSLEKYLFESNKIDWDTRFKIIKGICQGLHFLHKEMDRPVVHMDIRPDNIMLDDKMIPKISDFGLSRLMGQEQTRMNTQTVVGALGYMAPEYLYRGEISTQSDIYSLGILIIQISTGEKIKPSVEDKCGTQFIDQVRKNWTDRQIASMHAKLDAHRLKEIKKCIEIGLQCVDVDRKKRPPIEDIIATLNGKC